MRRSHSSKQLEAAIKFVPDTSSMKSALAELSKQMQTLENDLARAERNASRAKTNATLDKWSQQVDELRRKINDLGTFGNSIFGHFTANQSRMSSANAAAWRAQTAQAGWQSTVNYGAARVNTESSKAGYWNARATAASTNAQNAVMLNQARLNASNAQAQATAATGQAKVYYYDARANAATTVAGARASTEYARATAAQNVGISRVNLIDAQTQGQTTRNMSAQARHAAWATTHAQRVQLEKDVMDEAGVWMKRLQTAKKLQKDELEQLQAFYREYRSIIKANDIKITTELSKAAGFGGGGGNRGTRSGGGDGSNNPMLRFAKQLTGLYGVGYAARSLFGGYGNLVNGGIDDYSYFEKIRTMLAGSLNTYYNQRDNGKLVTDPGKRLSNAYAFSDTLFKQIRQTAIESPLTMRELLDTYGVGLPFLARRGLSTTQSLEVANTVASIGKAAGLREGSFADDLRALGGSGQFRNAQTFQIMGFDRTEFQKLSQLKGDEFMNAFRERAKGFQQPLKDFGNSLTSSVDRVKDALFTASLKFGEKLVPFVKKIAGDISDQMAKMEKDGTLDKFAQALASIMSGIGKVITFFVNNAEKIAMMIPGLNIAMVGAARDELATAQDKNSRLNASDPRNVITSFESNLRYALGGDATASRMIQDAKKSGQMSKLVSDVASGKVGRGGDAIGYYQSLYNLRRGDNTLVFSREDVSSWYNQYQRYINPKTSKSDAENIRDSFRGASGSILFDLFRDSPYIPTGQLNNRYGGYVVAQSKLGSKARAKAYAEANRKNQIGLSMESKGGVNPTNAGKPPTAKINTPDFTDIARKEAALNLEIAKLGYAANNANDPITKADYNAQISQLQESLARLQVERATRSARADLTLYGADGGRLTGAIGGKAKRSGGGLRPLAIGPDGVVTDKNQDAIAAAYTKKNEQVIQAEGRLAEAQLARINAQTELEKAIAEDVRKKRNAFTSIGNRMIDSNLNAQSRMPNADQTAINRQKTIRTLMAQAVGDFDSLTGVGINPMKAALTAFGAFGAGLKNFDSIESAMFSLNANQATIEGRNARLQADTFAANKKFDNRLSLRGLGGSDMATALIDRRLAAYSDILSNPVLTNMTGGRNHIEGLILALTDQKSAILQNTAMLKYTSEKNLRDAYDNALNPFAKYKSSAQQMKEGLDDSLSKIDAIDGSTPQGRAELMRLAGVGGMEGAFMNTDALRTRAKQRTIGNFNTQGYMNAQTGDARNNAFMAAITAMAGGGDPLHAFAGAYNSGTSQMGNLLSQVFNNTKDSKGKYIPWNKRLNGKQWGQLGGEVAGGAISSMLGGYSDLGMSLGSMAVSMGAFGGLGAWAGPVGMIGGALLGSLFGRKKGPSPEEQARKEHEKRLEQLLNSIDRSLRPQADYFRSIRSDVLFGSASRYFSGRAYSGLALSQSLGRL